jgi:hypothetical protein
MATEVVGVVKDISEEDTVGTTLMKEITTKEENDLMADQVSTLVWN